jgi:biotin carboxyl carrier protein
MKLEIAVKTPDPVVEALQAGRVKVEKVLVKPGDTVHAGSRLVLLRKCYIN